LTSLLLLLLLLLLGLLELWLVHAAIYYLLLHQQAKKGDVQCSLVQRCAGTARLYHLLNECNRADSEGSTGRLMLLLEQLRSEDGRKICTVLLLYNWLPPAAAMAIVAESSE
jgi:hypothetical protein